MNVTTAAAFVVVLGLACRASADEQLSRAKQLYDSAEYEGVLALVAGLNVGSTGPPVEAREYRALSLLALSRTTEAEQDIAAILEADPLYVPSATSAPRWKATVDRVRGRVWPVIIRNRYASAKQRFDSRDFAKAVPELETLKTLLTAAQKEGLPGLTDLMTLADGFLELSRASMPPPAAAPTPAPAPPKAVEAVPVAPVKETVVAVIKPPVAISRDFPRWEPPSTVRPWETLDGRISVLVDTDGSVKSSRIVDSVHPLYDSLLKSAASKWRFEPATRNGKPISYEVEVRVVLNPAAEQR